MSRICFVGNEIYPTTTGGAGFLVFNLARMLLAEDHEVILLLNVSRAAFKQFNTEDRELLADGDRLRAYHVDSLCQGIKLQQSDFLSRYTWEAACYDFACRQVYELEKPDIIEFVDYCGPAYYALNAKLCGLSYQESRLVVRLHGPLELIDQSTAYQALDFDRYTAYALERQCFRLAEATLYATPSFLEAYYDRSAELWFGEAVYAPPPTGSFPTRPSEVPGANIILFYGRLFAWKGPERFVDAALSLLASQPESDWQFYLVGYDSNQPPVSGPRSYQEYLLQKIPPAWRERFIFTGHLSHTQVAALLPRVLLAVVPSYFESYGYAAHEMRQAGVPLIVPELPVFRDAFQSETQALFFDGSAGDLARQMLWLANDPVLRHRFTNLGVEDQPADGRAANRAAPDPLDFYRRPGWESWIADAGDRTQPVSLQVGVMDTGVDGAVRRTLDSLKAAAARAFPQNEVVLEVMVLQPADPTTGETAALTWYLGKPYILCRPDGGPYDGPLTSREAWLALRAGDEVEADFLRLSLELLARQPQVGYVCCWKTIQAGQRDWLQTHPLPAMPELLAVEADSPYPRAVLRTRPGLPLSDAVEERLNQYGEAAAIWRLEDSPACGVQIAQSLIRQPAEAPQKSGGSSLAYLLLDRLSPPRAARLARYLGMLATRYPQDFLPLQAAWAEKSGFETGGAAQGSILVQPGWRRRLYLRLSRGGRFSQVLLAGLTWGWQNWKNRGLSR